MEQAKIFEMPLPGYLGFPAFALACFTMYVFVGAVTVRLLGLQLSGAAADAGARSAVGRGHTIAL